jgi:type IV pilus assembly protein PilA
MLQRLRHRVHGQEGFTLIELLVVILIIGILAAVAIPAFLNQKGKANDANVKADISSAQTAEETFFTNGQVYSAVNADLTAIEPSLSSAFATVANNGDAMSLATPAVSTFGSTMPGSPTASTANSYVITATSKSTVQYALVHNSDGTLSRVCSVPSGINAGGCKVTSGSSGNGTW